MRSQVRFLLAPRIYLVKRQPVTVMGARRGFYGGSISWSILAGRRLNRVPRNDDVRSSKGRIGSIAGSGRSALWLVAGEATVYELLEFLDRQSDASADADGCQLSGPNQVVDRAAANGEESSCMGNGDE
jgi:hypothetical protein